MTAKIKLNSASGGGSISIQAPSSSSNNRVISLPDIADGTLLTSQSTLDSTKLSPAIAAGITEFDSWRISSNYAVSNGYGNFITANWERDDTVFEKIGTGLSESSGVFSFPSTGKYLVNFSFNLYRGSAASYLGCYILVSTDSGSNFTRRTESFTSTGNGDYEQLTSYKMIDVTSTNFRIKFELEVQGDATVARGDSNSNRTGFTCMRLGDT